MRFIGEVSNMMAALATDESSESVTTETVTIQTVDCYGNF